MKVSIAADHGGYELKFDVVEWLKELKQYTLIDLGNEVYNENDDYPDFAERVAKNVTKGDSDRGILICGSGVGVSIAANKIRNAKAAVCHDLYSAHQGVEHDNMNIICLGAQIIDFDFAKELITAFLEAKFKGDQKYIRRLEKIRKLENKQVVPFEKPIH